MIAPNDISLNIPSNLSELYPFLDSKEIQGLVEEFGREHKDFLAISKAVDLNKYYLECVGDKESEMELD